MKKIFALLFAVSTVFLVQAQTPKTYTSSEILLQLKKMNVLGSVLYIAAHPDDENTRLLAYLANEKMYRTGYLSLTRGDGGQNLIGDEQGIDLGLIRTQELLAARNIDGAEQFFSTAYDFGFCKTPEEALNTWNHDKILGDVVWVIRKFRPDVIIARFPEDSRAGHGHHAASGILAREAFTAAADSTKYPEQLKQGVTVWQAKRMLWNTFNFGGGTDTRNESQFKLEVGMYNPLLGKGYGEIAALSRSQHKSQGFGVPAQRGSFLEYFETIKGDKPVNSLLDGVDAGWSRIPFAHSTTALQLRSSIDSIIQQFKHDAPEQTVPALLQLRSALQAAIASGIKEDITWNHWLQIKLAETEKMILVCSGIFAEATAASQLNTIGDSIKINVAFNNRLALDIDKADVEVFGESASFSKPAANQQSNKLLTHLVDKSEKFTQPYWLEWEKTGGSFTVHNQGYIGMPQVIPYVARFKVYFKGTDVLEFTRPVQYKYTDPIKGELYEPIQLVEPFFISSKPALVLMKNGIKNQRKPIDFTIQSNVAIKDSFTFKTNYNNKEQLIFDSVISFPKMGKKEVELFINADSIPDNSSQYISGTLSGKLLHEHQYFALNKIAYDHIPDIYYNYIDGVKIVKLDLKTAGSSVGYIVGAGDKVPQALEQMGYKVTLLKQHDITPANLKQFDAVITGVRAYNTNDWMADVYDVLMQYVNDGGVLVTQYNTNNFISSIKSRIGPYPFGIGRTRVTDETAKVNFLIPNHPVLNYPNKITDKDFEGWIQERSVYHAEKTDSSYQRIISMKDPGDKEDDGSLIVADYGKGRFVYTGLVFFRELPAGVPGAYRLFANLIAPPQAPGAGASKGAAVKEALPKKSSLSGKAGKE